MVNDNAKRMDSGGFFYTGGFLMRAVKNRRILALVLVFSFVISVLTGCGGYALKKKESNVSYAKAETSDIFKTVPTPLDMVTTSSVDSEDDLGAEGLIFSSTFAKNGKYYTLYSDMGSAESTTLSAFDASGKNASKISLPVPKEGMVNCISADEEGRIYMVTGESDEEDNMVYKISCLGKKQKAVWSVKIKANQDFEPQAMVTANTFTAVLANNGLYTYDNKKGSQKSVKLPENNMLAKICTDKKGNVLLVGWPDDKLTVWSFDRETMKFKKTKTFSGNYKYTDGVASGNGKYDFYLASADSVYGFQTDGSKPVRIVDFVASSQQFIEISCIALLSPDSILVLSYDDDMNSIPTLLKKVDEKAAGAIKTITVGCLSTPYWLTEDVYKFNKSSEKFKIRVIEYSQSEDDVGALNSVIATGDVPDIICVNDNMPIESYVNKGVFEDIESLFRGDAELSGSQYLENILDAYRVNGKMYFITPSFSLIGLVGSKKYFGDDPGVSISKIESLIKKNNMNYERAMGLSNRDSVMNWITNYSVNQFADLEAGTCSFDSKEFIALLKFIKKFPKKISSRITQEDSNAWVRSGKQLMSELNLSSVGSYIDMRYGIFGEEISYTGLPGNDNDGPVIYSPVCMGICKESENKEEAWEFLRTYYLEEYQNKLSNIFPVNKEALNRQFEDSMEQKYSTYTDEKGKKVTEKIEDYYIISGTKIILPLPDDEDIKQILEFLEKANKRSCVDTHISEIVSEETGAYLENQKSVEEVTDIIQRRVNIYIKEMM